MKDSIMMRKRHLLGDGGFTLLELMLAVVVFGVVGSSVLQFLGSNKLVKDPSGTEPEQQGREAISLCVHPATFGFRTSFTVAPNTASKGPIRFISHQNGDNEQLVFSLGARDRSILAYTKDGQSRLLWSGPISWKPGASHVVEMNTAAQAITVKVTRPATQEQRVFSVPRPEGMRGGRFGWGVPLEIVEGIDFSRVFKNAQCE